MESQEVHIKTEPVPVETPIPDGSGDRMMRTTCLAHDTVGTSWSAAAATGQEEKLAGSQWTGTCFTASQSDAVGKHMPVHCDVAVKCMPVLKDKALETDLKVLPTVYRANQQLVADAAVTEQLHQGLLFNSGTDQETCEGVGCVSLGKLHPGSVLCTRSVQSTGSVVLTGSVVPTGNVLSTGSALPTGSVLPTGGVLPTESVQPTGSELPTESVVLTGSVGSSLHIAVSYPACDTEVKVEPKLDPDPNPETSDEKFCQNASMLDVNIGSCRQTQECSEKVFQDGSLRDVDPDSCQQTQQFHEVFQDGGVQDTSGIHCQQAQQFCENIFQDANVQDTTNTTTIFQQTQDYNTEQMQPESVVTASLSEAADVDIKTEDDSAIPTGLYKNIFIKSEPSSHVADLEESASETYFADGAVFTGADPDTKAFAESFGVLVSSGDYSHQLVAPCLNDMIPVTPARKKRGRQTAAMASNQRSSKDHSDTKPSCKRITECFVNLTRLPDGMLSHGVFRVPKAQGSQPEALPVDLRRVKLEDTDLSMFLGQDRPAVRQLSKEFAREDDKKHPRNSAVVAALKKKFHFEEGGSLREQLMSLHQPTTRHSKNGVRRFVCKICGQGYKTASACSQHKKIHIGIKEHQCKVCGKAFIYKSTLTKHMDIHADIRPYPCPLCGKAFRWSSHLRAHLGRHSSERPFECEVCGMRFKQKDYLHNHSIAHTTDRPFKCTDCDKTFKTSQCLKIHRRQHTDEKPFKCSECPAAFRHKNVLDTHIRGIHTKERPYKCKLCSATFTQNTHLRTHARIHSDPKREARFRRLQKKAQEAKHKAELNALREKLKPPAPKSTQLKKGTVSTQQHLSPKKGTGNAQPIAKKTKRKYTQNPTADAKEPTSSSSSVKVSCRSGAVFCVPSDQTDSRLLQRGSSVTVSESTASEAFQKDEAVSNASGLESASQKRTKSKLKTNEPPQKKSKGKKNTASSQKNNTLRPTAPSTRQSGGHGGAKEVNPFIGSEGFDVPEVNPLTLTPPSAQLRRGWYEHKRVKKSGWKSPTAGPSSGESNIKPLPPVVDSLQKAVLYYRPLLLQAAQRKHAERSATQNGEGSS